MLWWKANTLRYPKLAEVARQLLAIHATSAASERMFSKARLVMPWNRCKLHASTLQSIMCLRDWLNIRVDDEDMDEEVWD
jgi:hypothetical protein